MPLMPKRVKYRKQQRGNRKGMAMSGNALAFGMIVIMTLTIGLYTWMRRRSERWMQ